MKGSARRHLAGCPERFSPSARRARAPAGRPPGTRRYTQRHLIVTLMKMKKSALFLILALSIPAFPAQSVTGLLKGATQPKQGTAQPDLLGRDTPSGTVVGFLQTAQSGNY